MKNYNYTCALCNISIDDLLICSHIVPWAIDEKNRLNQCNSICLCTWHNSLFDKGYITFDDKFSIMFSSKLSPEIIDGFRNLKFKLPVLHSPDIELLRYHRRELFIK